MQKEFYHNQLFGSIGGISMPLQQANSGEQDQEFPCPGCDASIGANERCPYCGFDLISWALSLQQSNSISETLAEMKLENVC